MLIQPESLIFITSSDLYPAAMQNLKHTQVFFYYSYKVNMYIRGFFLLAVHARCKSSNQIKRTYPNYINMLNSLHIFFIFITLGSLLPT